MLKTSLVAIMAVLMLSGNVVAADNDFSSKKKTEVIDRLATALTEKYVLIKEGKLFGQALQTLNRSGEFASSKTKQDFVRQLSRSVWEITQDKHMRVMVVDGGRRRLPRTTSHLETNILAGNIGLLTINNLMGSERGVDKAMAKLADTDGLIIDVRQCPGGSPSIVTQIMSYFMPVGETVIEMRQRGRPISYNISRRLPSGAKPYADKPITVVTSSNTGSGCEELSFDVKYHNLGYIVGKTTAGAGFALMSGPVNIGHGISVSIPNTKPKHPQYDFTFEKVGVTPDIEVSPALGIESAHQMTLSILIGEKGKSVALSQALEEVSAIKTRKAMALVSGERAIRNYLGSYGKEDKVIYDDGKLKVVTGSRRPRDLIKEKEDLFGIKDTRGDKIRFERDEYGKITGFSEYLARKSEWTFNKHHSFFDR